MSHWAVYQRKVTDQEMRPYVPGEDLTGISVHPDETPELGGMIARNAQDHTNQWYMAPEYFATVFEETPRVVRGRMTDAHAYAWLAALRVPWELSYEPEQLLPYTLRISGNTCNGQALARVVQHLIAQRAAHG